MTCIGHFSRRELQLTDALQDVNDYGIMKNDDTAQVERTRNLQVPRTVSFAAFVDAHVSHVQYNPSSASP